MHRPLAVSGYSIYLCRDSLWMVPVLICVGLAAGILIIDPLRRRAGQEATDDYAREAEAAPSLKAWTAVRWREFRTFQVWYLVLAAMGVTLIALEAFGIISW